MKIQTSLLATILSLNIAAVGFDFSAPITSMSNPLNPLNPIGLTSPISPLNPNNILDEDSGPRDNGEGLIEVDSDMNIYYNTIRFEISIDKVSNTKECNQKWRRLGAFSEDRLDLYAGITTKAEASQYSCSTDVSKIHESALNDPEVKLVANVKACGDLESTIIELRDSDAFNDDIIDRIEVDLSDGYEEKAINSECFQGSLRIIEID